jgi:hypothetical protein
MIRISMMRRSTRKSAHVIRIGLAVAALAALSNPGALSAAERAGASTDDMLHLAKHFEAALRDTIPILGHGADAETLWTALYDARRAVVEIDRILANASIFAASNRDRAWLLDLAARSHLRLALFETHGLEFERARQEIDRARSLSESLHSPDFRIEWVALQDGSTERGLQTRYHLMTPQEFEAALASIWSGARNVPFVFGGYGDAEVISADLSRSPEPPHGSLDARLFARGAALLREALEAGRRSFDVPLPPGVYRLRGGGGRLDRTFMVPEVSEVDAVVIDRARFSLRLDPKPGSHGPRFFLNGIEVGDLTTMPFGTYRVKVDENYFEGAPGTVRFIMGEGISDRTRHTWTVFVPVGGSALLRFERASLGKRLFRK